MPYKFDIEDKNIRVLVADDMSLSRSTSKRLLKELGFLNVDVVENGKLALERLENAHQERPYTLVLTDWVMPEMTGLELMKRINSSSWSNKPFVVMLTAEADASQVMQAVKEGISGYVIKPIKLEELRTALLEINRKRV